jgi:hypothetical protein
MLYILLEESQGIYGVINSENIVYTQAHSYRYGLEP